VYFIEITPLFSCATADAHGTLPLFVVVQLSQNEIHGLLFSFFNPQ